MKKSLPILMAIILFIGIFSYAFDSLSFSSLSVPCNAYAAPSASPQDNISAQASIQGTSDPKNKNTTEARLKYSLPEALNALRKTAEKLGIIKPSSQLTLYKRSDSELEIYTHLPEKKILLTRFDKKPWGTWNIGGWFIVDDNKIPSNEFHILAGGGTDWEYVLAVGGAPGKGYTFSGGNHGKEALKSIKILNGKDDSELEPKLNTPVKLDYLEIVEDTSLTFDNDLKNKYADVRRTYTISGSRIDFTSDFTYTSDVYMGTSYICMFPVGKQFGNHIRFNSTGKQFTTPSKGKTLSKPAVPNYIGKERTLSADIWSDSNPKYIFNVWIDSEDMTDNFNNSLKVFYWDFNEMTNKLYFSKYENTYNKVSAGTTWHNSQGWKLKTSQTRLELLTEEIKKIWLHMLQPNP